MMKAHIEPCFSIILEDNGKNIGQCFFQAYSTGYFLYGLYVEPEHRGRGGARLIIENAQKKLDRDIYLRADPFADNAMSKKQLTKFYQKLGFKKQLNTEVLKWSYKDEQKFDRNYFSG